LHHQYFGNTKIKVSPLGLGTVKFGRNQQVKYPQSFELPSDKEILDLLALAQDYDLNLLDTSPAYGASLTRLGKLLKNRQNWVIVSKAGEIFENNQSRFDFSYQGTIDSVKQQLKILKTDYLDVVMIHSNGQDCEILQKEGISQALFDLKQQGWIRAHGISGKTVAGGLQALELFDSAMVTCNLEYNDELAVLEKAQQKNKGILIKKGLLSGHLKKYGVEKAIQFIFQQPAVSSLIAGTINPQHLIENIKIVQAQF